MFQFRAVPFGIGMAPWLFQVVGVIKELFHRDGLSLFQYLEDWLGDAQNKGEVKHRSQLLVRLCAHLVSNQPSEI